MREWFQTELCFFGQNCFNKRMAFNVLGTQLISCSETPLTGFFRNGICDTCAEDSGMHTICALMDEGFLHFSVSRGNDLVTPRPEYLFPGLKPGDYWCVCLGRWLEALEAGAAPKVKLEACHASVVEFVDLDTLKQFSVS
jgi:uncharacterized protein (DUF2237 family)